MRENGEGVRFSKIFWALQPKLNEHVRAFLSSRRANDMSVMEFAQWLETASESPELSVQTFSRIDVANSIRTLHTHMSAGVGRENLLWQDCVRGLLDAQAQYLRQQPGGAPTIKDLFSVRDFALRRRLLVLFGYSKEGLHDDAK